MNQTYHMYATNYGRLELKWTQCRAAEIIFSIPGKLSLIEDQTFAMEHSCSIACTVEPRMRVAKCPEVPQQWHVTDVLGFNTGLPWKSAYSLRLSSLETGFGTFVSFKLLLAVFTRRAISMHLLYNRFFLGSIFSRIRSSTIPLTLLAVFSLS